MGFQDARRALIEALRSGAFEHEARDVAAERNRLAVGEVGPGFVIDLLRRARGDRYSASPHHFDASVTVHVFRCHDGPTNWCVKAYFLGESKAVFISVHPSD